MNNKDRLKKIVKFVTRRTGADILNKSRQTDVTDARALYYKIALRDTRASMNVIGSVVGKSHATVIHTRNNVLPLIEQDVFYMNIYREYFGEEIEQDVIRDVDNEILTDNEKMYRGLSNEDKKIYDERALLVLKSFEWKRKDENRKEVFETINVSM
tara:strand:+ start:1285 stop:1752 length:468 start_codon:yes stop_codon:yes gene_type:complete